MPAFMSLALAAFGAGFINAFAGGGAFLTFPALLLAGVPAVDANASSTVALFPGQLTSTLAYRTGLRAARTDTQVRLAAFVTISLAGGLLGALLLLFTPQETFARFVPWLLLFATGVFAAGTFGLMDRLSLTLGPRSILVIQAIISVYGGYFGGGIGILMLAAFTLYGLRDIRVMNSMRILLATLMNAAAVIAFVVAGRVHWRETSVMIVAGIAGGYIGALVGQRIKPAVVKAAVIVVGLTLTSYFFLKGA